MTASSEAQTPAGPSWLHDKNAHLVGLTILRAFAAMWVVLFHYRGTLDAWVPGFSVLDPIMSVGFLGVDLFFALSGFVIAHRYLEDMGSSLRLVAVRDFLVLRFARLYPVHLFMIVVLAVYVAVTSRTGNDTGYDPATYGTSALIQNLTLTHAWFNQSLTWNGQSWSISAEWLAYLVFPLLALVLIRVDRSKRAVGMALGIVIVVYLPLVLVGARVVALPDIGDGPFGYSVVRIGAGFIGGAAAFIMLRRWVRARELSESKQALMLVRTSVIVVVLAVLWWVGTGQPAVDAVGASGNQPDGIAAWLTPPLLCLVVAIASLSVPRRLSGRRPIMVTLGLASYSLYMVHTFFFMVAGGTEGGGVAERLGIDSAPAFIQAAYALAAVFGCVVAAVLMYHWVEEPSRKFLRRLVPRAGTTPVEARESSVAEAATTDPQRAPSRSGEQ